MNVVGVLFAAGFEEIEAITIVDVLRRAEFNVIMVGIADGNICGAHNIPVVMDKTIADVCADDFDAVVLPGGMPGSENLANNADVIHLLQQMNNEAKYIGAICAAPIVLHAAGIINNKTVTCYPSFETQLGHVTYTGRMVSVDGNIVTGQGPGAAIDFSLKLVSEMGYPEKAEELAKNLLANSNYG